MISHAHLIIGEDGIGKSLIAKKFAMNILGVNIENSINMALRGEDFEFDDLFKKYAFAGFNLKIYFKNAYNRENFAKSLNNSLKRERRN